MMRIKHGMDINEVLKARTDLVLRDKEEFEGDVYETYIGIAFENDYNNKMYVDVINGIVDEVGICAIV